MSQSAIRLATSGAPACHARPSRGQAVLAAVQTVRGSRRALGEPTASGRSYPSSGTHGIAHPGGVVQLFGQYREHPHPDLAADNLVIEFGIDDPDWRGPKP